MSFLVFTKGIPNPPALPSTNVNAMQTNTNSESDIWNIDHFGYNNNQGGYHNVIHQPPQIIDPATIAGIGQTYTKTVGSDVELFYKSSLGVVNQITDNSSILPRVAVNFTVPAGVVIIQNSFNVASVVRLSKGVFVITFNSALSSAFYYSCINAQVVSSATTAGFSISTGAGVFTTTTSIQITIANNNGVTDPITCSVIVFL